MHRHFNKFLLVTTLLLTSLYGCGGGGGGTNAGSDTGGGSADCATSTGGVTGRYTYDSDATTMNCDTGDVYLPDLTSTIEFVQNGTSLTATSPGDSAVLECSISSDKSFTCSGTYIDANSTISYEGIGQFTGKNYEINLYHGMVTAQGHSCSWSRRSHGARTGNLDCNE